MRTLHLRVKRKNIYEGHLLIKKSEALHKKLYYSSMEDRPYGYDLIRVEYGWWLFSKSFEAEFIKVVDWRKDMCVIQFKRV